MVSATTPNYRIIWHVTSKFRKPIIGSPFRSTRKDALQLTAMYTKRLMRNLHISPSEVTWELEYRKEGIDRWEIVETSKRIQ